MRAIADRGGPEALELFCEVLTASASIPGGFPPVLIKAQPASEPDAPSFDQMHVDGGVTIPFIAVPPFAQDQASVDLL